MAVCVRTRTRTALTSPSPPLDVTTSQRAKSFFEGIGDDTFRLVLSYLTVCEIKKVLREVSPSIHNIEPPIHEAIDPSTPASDIVGPWRVAGLTVKMAPPRWMGSLTKPFQYLRTVVLDTGDPSQDQEAHLSTWTGAMALLGHFPALEDLTLTTSWVRVLETCVLVLDTIPKLRRLDLSGSKTKDRLSPRMAAAWEAFLRSGRGQCLVYLGMTEDFFPLETDSFPALKCLTTWVIQNQTGVPTLSTLPRTALTAMVERPGGALRRLVWLWAGDVALDTSILEAGNPASYLDCSLVPCPETLLQTLRPVVTTYDLRFNPANMDLVASHLSAHRVAIHAPKPPTNAKYSQELCEGYNVLLSKVRMVRIFNLDMKKVSGHLGGKMVETLELVWWKDTSAQSNFETLAVKLGDCPLLRSLLVEGLVGRDAKAFLERAMDFAGLQTLTLRDCLWDYHMGDLMTVLNAKTATGEDAFWPHLEVLDLTGSGDRLWGNSDWLPDFLVVASHRRSLRVLRMDVDKNEGLRHWMRDHHSFYYRKLGLFVQVYPK